MIITQENETAISHIIIYSPTNQIKKCDYFHAMNVFYTFLCVHTIPRSEWYNYIIFRLVTVQSMSFFFKEGSQVSEYQNTAFFQNGEASKVSIFDNPPQSETQLAYDLFNAESVPRERQERSIISQLDILDRREDFTQTPLPAEPRPISKRDTYVESQESKDSRMTFGAKLNNKLRESQVEKQTPKFFEERKEPSKPKILASGVRQRPSQPSSSFSLLRQGPSIREPDSMPVKFEGHKPAQKPIFEVPSNSSSSSFSIDFDQIRQRNQLEVKPLAKQMTSMRLNNERELKDGRSESGKSEKIELCSTDSRFEEKEAQKQKRFGFNLRRSKVTEEQKDNKVAQSGFLFKNSSPNSTNVQNNQNTNNVSPISHLKQEVKMPKNEEKAQPSEESMITPFKMKLKETSKDLPTDKILITSNVKRVEPQRSSIFNRNPQEPRQQAVDAQKLPETKFFEKDHRKTIDNRINQAKSVQDTSLEKDSSVRSESNEQSKKRQSIGLKEQLKKLTSRPTEKVELKSIAFNKSFKLKPRVAEEKPQAKIEEANPVKENGGGQGFTLQKPMQIEQKSNNRPFMALKEEKSEFTPAKQAKSTEFSKYMLMLMEIQQESESLKGKTERSRNFYRELAILNNDINRRIEEVLKDTSKR